MTVAMRLRAPAIAAGVKSMDFISTPPRDQRIAVASKSRTCLFKAKIFLRKETKKIGLNGRNQRKDRQAKRLGTKQKKI